MKKLTLLTVALVSLLFSCTKEEINTTNNTSDYGYYIVNGTKHNYFKNSWVMYTIKSEIHQLYIGNDLTYIDSSKTSLSITNLTNNKDSLSVRLYTPGETFKIHKNTLIITDLGINYPNSQFKLYNVKGSFKSPKGNIVEINVKPYKM